MRRDRGAADRSAGAAAFGAGGTTGSRSTLRSASTGRAVARPGAGRRDRLRDRVDVLVRHRWPLLIAVAVAAAAAHLASGAFLSWHFVAEGARTLVSPAGLHLYALHPELQMGPLTFLVGAPFTGPVLGRPVAAALMVGAGLLALRELWLLGPARDPAAARRWMLAALPATVVWSEVAVHYAHLDDAIALLCAARAIRLASGGRTLQAAVLAGLAVDFKPWTLPIAALLLADRSRALPALAVFAGLVAVVWAPFLLADPGTLRTARFTIAVDPVSSLRVFGVLDSRTPWWVRPVQLGGGSVLVLAAARRGAWSSVLMLLIALRMVVDPAAWLYYDSGLLLAAVALDTRSRTPFPVAAIVALVGVDVVQHALPPAAAAPLRTATLLGLIVLAVLPLLRRTGPQDPRQRGPALSAESPTGSAPAGRTR